MKKLFLALTLVASSLPAALLSVSGQTSGFDNNGGNQNGRTTGSGQTINIAQFNSALGTLTGVTIRATTYLKYEFSVTNNELVPIDVTYGFFPAGASNPQVVVTGDTLNFTQQGTAAFLDYPSGTIPGLAGGATQSVPRVYETGNNGAGVAGVVANFIGLGNVVFNTTPTASFTADCTGDCAATHSSRYGVRIDVDYEYTPATTGVPEPSTMALLGSALVGLGMVARRRK